MKMLFVHVEFMSVYTKILHKPTNLPKLQRTHTLSDSGMQYLHTKRQR